MARRDRRRDPPRDAVRLAARPRRAHVARQRGGLPPRRAPHGPGRLPGEPVLLDRLVHPRGKRGPRGRRAARRRGLAVPGPRRPPRGQARDPRPAGRVLRLATRRERPSGPARRRRLRRRPALRDGRRARCRRRHAPFRLLYSVRTPADVFFADELAALAGPRFELDLVYTREAPDGWPDPVGRLTGRRSPPAPSRRPTGRASSCAARRGSSKRSPPGCKSSATPHRTSTPSASEAFR